MYGRVYFVIFARQCQYFFRLTWTKAIVKLCSQVATYFANWIRDSMYVSNAAFDCYRKLVFTVIAKSNPSQTGSELVENTSLEV